jgi:small subunit ribosomal protein S7
MTNKKIDIKSKIINHLMLDGRKKTSEKILLKSFKELQKYSKKQPKKLVELAIIFSTPIFKIHKIMNKKRKKKNIKEIPTLITTKKARISLAIKFILNTLKNKRSNSFYLEFHKEILTHMKNEGSAIQVKNETQKQALLKKHFFSYYRWR